MTESLASWYESPRADRGLRFLGDSGIWTFYSYELLLSRAFALSSRLIDAGCDEGGVVCLFLPTGPDLFSAIFGSWAAGCSINALVPPSMFDDEEEYVGHVARIMSVANPHVVVTDEENARFVERAISAAALEHSVIVKVGVESSDAFPRRDRSKVALLQFTSGSSGAPRGVQVSFDNLESNIAAIRRWIQMGSDDATATWLPLYHDMGLIGCLLTPTVNQSDVWVMRPDQFVRDPAAWLSCFGREGASLCASPNFGYGYAARKADLSKLEGCDFSSWRVAIAGAEQVDAGALTLFTETFSPLGFRNRAFLPAYGLAEATLAVTGSSPNVVARAVELDWSNLRMFESVDVLRTASIEQLNHENALGWLVGSGKSHPGAVVRILGAAGEEVPEGVLGEILVGGDSVALGYTDSREDGASRFCDGAVLTGDAGFLLDGELYVVGRIADSIKVRGRWVYADDLEARLAAMTGLRRGRCVVVTVPTAAGGSVLAIGEEVDREWIDFALSTLKDAVAGIAVTVVGAPRGTILRTSSGKPRRRSMWERFVAGDMANCDQLSS